MSAHLLTEAEEHQTAARRRHRKRVARIVVDHWKWFARDRLKEVRAQRHYTRQLLMSAWVSMQHAMQQQASNMRRANVFNSRRSVLLLGSCLRVWSGTARRLGFLRDGEALLSNAREAKMKAAVLQEWRQAPRVGAAKRKMKLKTNRRKACLLLVFLANQMMSALANFIVAAKFFSARLSRKHVSIWRLAYLSPNAYNSCNLLAAAGICPSPNPMLAYLSPNAYNSCNLLAAAGICPSPNPMFAGLPTYPNAHNCNLLVTAGFCPDPNPMLAYLSQCGQVMQPVGHSWHLS
eukprot:gene2737-12609_t